MEYILIGKLVNTHGLKGEVKVISDFLYKEIIFNKNNKIYIDNNPYTIVSYRKHNLYDLLTLDGIDTIDKANVLKGFNIYIKFDEYNFSTYLDQELVGFDVYDNDIYKGKIIDIAKTKLYSIFVVEGKKKHMIPYTDIFVKSIDKEKKIVYVNYIKGLDCED